MVLLGDKWNRAILPLRLIPIIMPFKMTYSMMDTILTSIGKPNIPVINMIYNLIVMSLGFYIGVHFGLIGVSYVWIIFFPPVLILMQLKALPLFNISFFEFYKQTTLKPFLITGLMYLIVTLAKSNVIFITNEIVKFIILILTGILCFVLLAFKFQRDTISEIKGLVRT